MAMEVVCGNCQGRLLVEHTGVIVACPHCGAHLQIGDPAPPVVEAHAPAPDLPPVPQYTPPPEFAPPPVPPQSPLSAAPQPEAPPFVPPSATTPIPASLEAPPTNPFQASVTPEPVFPDFNLTPPAAQSPLAETAPAAQSPQPVLEPALATPAAPFAPPSWEPPSSSRPLPETASDSWMPQINLTMPNIPAKSPPVPQSAVPAPPPLAIPETATALTPAMPVADLSPSTINLMVPHPNESPAHQTHIWNAPQAQPPQEQPLATAFPSTEPSFADFGNFSATPATTTAVAPEIKVTPTPTIARAPSMVPAANTPVSSSTAVPASPAGPVIVTSNDRRNATVPRVYFVIVASYASAITLAFLYLWWRGSVSTLDLPDVVPAFKNGQFGLTLIEETPLPPAFRMKLGESKRFGNLLVTPVKVTKSPLEFVHFGDDKQTKPPSATPVLKLWVKFENVSADQTFPALDEKLLFQRAPDRQNATQDRTNNYVCLQSERKRIGKRVPVYTFPINGEWLLKDQNLNQPLSPKEEWETYIPTNDEDLSELKGPLCWRMHFRKGYNPVSRRGVTTLLEVEFNSKDIQADS